MRNVRSTVEGAFFAALTVILYLASIYLPVLGVLVSFLCPLPVMFLVIRWDARLGILASCVASLLVFALAGLLQAVTCLLGFSLLGIAMGLTVKRGYDFPEIILINTLVSLLSKFALLGVALLATGKNPLTENLLLLEETVRKAPWVSQNLHGAGDFASLVKLVMPALLIVASLFDTGCNFLLGRWIGKRIGITFPDVPPFSEWRLPRSVFWAFALGWVFVLFGGTSLFGRIGVNVQVVTQLLFLLEGLSLVYYFLGKYIHSRAVRVAILVFLLLQPLFSFLLSWLGVFDVFFDFRKLSSKR